MANDDIVWQECEGEHPALTVAVLTGLLHCFSIGATGRCLADGASEGRPGDAVQCGAELAAALPRVNHVLYLQQTGGHLPGKMSALGFSGREIKLHPNC